MDHITSSGQRLFHSIKHLTMAARVSVIMIVLTMAGCATVALAEQPARTLHDFSNEITLKSHNAHE
jgi:hypothetical protein